MSEKKNESVSGRREGAGLLVWPHAQVHNNEIIDRYLSMTARHAAQKPERDNLTRDGFIRIIGRSWRNMMPVYSCALGVHVLRISTQFIKQVWMHT